MWNDTAASYFLSVQYRPLDYYYNLLAADLGIYYYNPAHNVNFSLRGGGGSTYPVTKYATGESHAVFLKPGAFCVQNRLAKNFQTILGMNLIYMYEKDHIDVIHVDTTWGDLRSSYRANMHKFGAGLVLTFFIKITSKLQGMMSLEANCIVYNTPQILTFQYWTVGGYNYYPYINASLGLAYKLNK